MKKHRPRIKKPVKKITNSRSKAITVQPDNGAPIYYHGGAPHLKQGDYILPRTETGHQPRRGADWETDPILYCDDLIYFTTNREVAAFYAAWHRSRCGQVYSIAPEGEITPDPDYSWRDDIFRCARARVVSVARVPANLMQRFRFYLHDRGFRDLTEFYALLDEYRIG